MRRCELAASRSIWFSSMLQLEHLRDRGVHERLRRDILAPARALGCRSIWLAGISLGGFIALDYAAGHPEDWDGLCLLAPYLGNRMLIAQIAGSPGLAAWQPGPLAECRRRAANMAVHRFAAREARRARREAHVPGVRARGPLRTRARPDGRGARTECGACGSGGHDWPTWSALWEHFLDSTFP